MVATSRPRTIAAAAPHEDAALLRHEAVWFARYLVDAIPEAALVERYVQANARLFAGPPTAGDAAILAFLHAHPWTLALLDAGTAFAHGAPLLRQKLVVMMAILEATPDFVDQTSQVDGVGLPLLAWRLGRAGAVAALKLVTGTALAAVVTRGTR
ncbi:MAG: Nucleoside-diphosphate-sugar epimerase [Myxococcales bacterium]|nr:Nucleoside-diphosphate-sugar epimerase [Myxococcales bacterium]